MAHPRNPYHPDSDEYLHYERVLSDLDKLCAAEPPPKLIHICWEELGIDYPGAEQRREPGKDVR